MPPPTIMFRRRWRKLNGGVDACPNIRAMSTENVVFHVATQEQPTTSYTRALLGIAEISPTVNRRRTWTTPELKLLSNTNQDSAFVHTCLKCTGQHGKILEFNHYLIRIGRSVSLRFPAAWRGIDR